MFANDQPISKPSDDLFNRNEFALTIARSISGIRVENGGFAFALTGKWGFGKTSVLRLIERHLRHLEMAELSQTPLWWQKNPSSKTEQQLEAAASLYEEIEPHIQKLQSENKYLINASLEFQRSIISNKIGDTNPEKIDATLCYWHLLEKFKTTPNIVVLHFSPWLIAGEAELASALIGELARAIGSRFGTQTKDALRAVLKRLSQLAPIAGASLDLTGLPYGGLLRATGASSTKIVEQLTTGPTLDSLRGQLHTALRNLSDQRILVVIDDIDRLRPAEAAKMISLIKSLGDLPNTVFLLSYDRQIVSNLLKSKLKVNGAHYLEKIVQTTVELPPIDENDILKAVNEDIKSVFPNHTFDAIRLGRLWYGVLRHYVRNPRDIRRYFNSLALAQPGLSGVTDPIDLMILQALHVFEPAVYWYIRDNITDFAS